VRRHTGQALVEFALIAPVLLLIIGATVDLGRGLLLYTLLEGASRDTAPVGGQAVVAVYCGASVDCAGSANLQVHSEVDVYVYYGFNDLNLLGGLVTLTGSSKTTTSW